MRKMIKQFVAILVLLSLAFCFAGCDALDRMRDEHAVFAGETDHSAITFRGETYRSLEIEASDEKINMDYSSGIHVTAPDVPVLLSSSVGQFGYTGAEEKFIFLFRDVNAVYAREDIYEAALAETKMEDPYTHFHLRWIDEEGHVNHYDMTAEEIDIIRAILAREPQPETGYNDDSYSVYGWRSIIEASETGLYYREHYDIIATPEGYFIREYTFTDKGVPLLYLAEGEGEQLLKKLLEKYPR